MRGINPKDIDHAWRREGAKRHLDSLAPADRDAEISYHLVDVSKIAREELIARLTDDPFQQEVQARHLESVAAEIAGPDPPPLVKLLAKSIALLAIERDVADWKFYKLISVDVSCQFARDLLRWRAFTHRKLNSAIRTLAYVRRVDATTVEQVIDRLRIAS